MCWSAPVAASFAAFEFVSLVIIACRVRYAAAKWRGPADLWILPLLSTILAIELLEAIAWGLDVVDPLPTDEEALEVYTCPWANVVITRIALIPIALQPFCAVLPIWGTAPPNGSNSRETFKLPLLSAGLVSIGIIASLVVGELFGDSTPAVAVQPLSCTNSLGFAADQTCTFIGAHGHLHWTLRMSMSWLSPGGFAYAVAMVVPVFFARPFAPVGMPFLIFLGIFAALIVRMGGSFEAASVWCWSALALILYFVLYPYVLAVYPERRARAGDKVQALIVA